MKAVTVARTQELLLIDDDYDRSCASDGFSRYGAYLAMRLPLVAGDDPEILTDPVRWAAFAWATATSPVMTPGYLAWNDPIEDIEVTWDDGRLGAEIVIRTELPVRLTGWRSWDQDLCGNLVEPWPADRVALGRLSLRTVVDVSLPEAPGTGATHKLYVDAAKAAVSLIGSAVETALAPVLLALGDGGGCLLTRRGRP